MLGSDLDAAVWTALNVLLAGWLVFTVVWLLLRPRRSPVVPQLPDAVEHGDVELARWLLEHHAYLDAALVDQALGYADVEMVRLLQAFGADLGRSRLHEAAAASAEPRVIEALLALGFDPGRADERGWTPLHHAAAHGHTRVAKALLAAGADLTARTARGQSPADLAAANGQPWPFKRPTG